MESKLYEDHVKIIRYHNFSNHIEQRNFFHDMSQKLVFFHVQYKNDYAHQVDNINFNSALITAH